MIIHMRIGTKVFTVLVMLFVLTGQTMASSGVSSCDMDIHEMAKMDHSSMDMSHDGMDNNTMDCCDVSCAMDCGLSMVLALIETPSFGTQPASPAKIAIPDAAAIKNSKTTLYHPPISA
jgi:hypothetical protein|tara:strand:+ start:168 stop:524 length:357 start_codon:yes stop_codon:yes gene_type:complete